MNYGYILRIFLKCGSLIPPKFEILTCKNWRKDFLIVTLNTCMKLACELILTATFFEILMVLHSMSNFKFILVLNKFIFLYVQMSFLFIHSFILARGYVQPRGGESFTRSGRRFFSKRVISLNDVTGNVRNVFIPRLKRVCVSISKDFVLTYCVNTATP